MMRVTMQTIMAGPQGTADAGETIEVTDKLGKALKDGRFATDPVARRASATSDHALAAAITGKSAPVETEAERDAREANERAERARIEGERETAAKTPEAVKAALDQLNPEDDEDWTAKGKASVARVKELTGSTTITRDEIDSMFPDFARPSDETPADDDTNGGGNGGGTGGTATPSGRGRTSNR